MVCNSILKFIIIWVFLEAVYLIGAYLGYRQGRNDAEKDH